MNSKSNGKLFTQLVVRILLILSCFYGCWLILGSLELDQTNSKDKELNSIQRSQKENCMLLSTVKVEKRGRKRLGNGKIKGAESGACTPTTTYNGDHFNVPPNSLVAALAQSLSVQKVPVSCSTK